MRPENHECGERGLSDDIVFHEPGTLENETCPEGAQTSVPDLHERIVRHCAPTLAGLKCGSMFRVNSDPHGILSQVSELEYELSHRGLRLDALVVDEEGCLLYVYRPKLLEARLADPEVRDFLSCYGYAARSCSSTLAELFDRFAHCPTVPPEVGVFLDYPMEDVRGYIENEGRCSRCIGCWKVYGDVEAAEKRFNCYKRCRDVFSKRLAEGCSLVRLTVKC
ncbi:DUF3793 family protein [Methanomassiliicoccaceae archaeon DOK]|nr:DUF3793 family protein [Methanomassiliicoccaceae archaeon DOK]